MPKFIDLTGRKVGIIVVLGRSNYKHPDYKNIYWWVRCKCGKVYELCGAHIRSKNCKSCGCQKRESIRNTRFAGYGQISLTRWNTIRREAKQRNLKFEIDIKYVWKLYEKQNKRCALSGIKIFFNKFTKGRRTASLDRIDSSKGYIKGNVWWLHKTVNKLKRDYQLKEFLKWINKIAEHQKK